jgi:rhamnose utilization protein RhaD (predicted bifunctional aldolase and dehydrogenase)/NAD(P)-dependent dehydrogenase (short-subunit alcohol dehydrogenase family)
MEDRWTEAGAAEARARWGTAGEDLALRTFSARLIGADPALVLHGGGNTSVKTWRRDALGEPVEVLCVKGSGWDLARVEPVAHPAVELAFLRKLRALDALSDEAMVNAVRTHQLDADAPTPSIETLLHAFLPHKFVDHSHADAICALTNRAGGEAAVRDALGDRVAIVPYVKAGFDLAKAAADAFDVHPGVEGLVLLHHGLFTFGATAEESYHRHIALVTRAEAWLAARRPPAPIARGDVEAHRARALAVLPALRRALATRTEDGFQRWILHWRTSDEIRAWVDDPRLAPRVAQGPLTPDHTIRTKPLAAVVDGDVAPSIEAFRASYRAYFERHATPAHRRLDDTPRVVWVAGAGLFGVGKTAEEAAAAADIAEATHRVKVGMDVPHQPLRDDQLFEMEYWSLEQAKLARASEPPLARRVALITGAAGAIGTGIASALRAAGAHLVLTDLAAPAADGPRTLSLAMDVTDAASVEAAFAQATLHFGGVDLVVANAGIAATGSLADLDEAEFRRVVEVNLHGTFLTLRAAARWLGGQRTGGQVVVISTKNVFEPGAEFGAYSASKTGAHQLARVAALELARDGIRVNLVSPDAVFAEGPIQSGLWAAVGPGRARARGVEPEALPELYRQKNLLKARITGRHVGNAVVFLASEATPTTGAVIPVDGGLPGAFPR